MPMNSWDEDALFTEWGWEKDLIQRCYRAPNGQNWITFDSVMEATQEPAGERQLRIAIQRFGVKVGTTQGNN